MYWLCLICDNENKNVIENNIHEKQKYCSKCRNFNVLGTNCNDTHYHKLLDKYLTINHKISELSMTTDIYPRYIITHKFFEECYTSHHILVPKINLLHYIKGRLRYNSYNIWEKHKRKICNKRYKKIIGNKLENRLSLRPLKLIENFL